MEVFEISLTGTDGQIDGLVNTVNEADTVKQYIFSSFDGSLVLIIAKGDDGNWKRVSSTEPYLSGWADELGGQIDQRNPPAF